MAQVSYNFDDSFMKQLEKMGNTDEIITKILNGIGPIIVEREKALLLSHKRSGDMIKSIKATKVKKNDYGFYVVVRPTGKDEKGVRNMEKFIYNEYGTSKQSADPIQKKVINDTDKEIADKAQQIFNEEVSK